MKLNFPDLENYIENLKLLESLDLKELNQIGIQEKYIRYAIELPQFHYEYFPEDLKNQFFYRARKNINEEIEDVSLINTFSYPHSSFIRENSRANVLGKSVFYCSNDSYAAMCEVKPEIGDHIYISIWQPKFDRNMRCVICLPDNLDESNIYYDIKNGILNNFNKKADSLYGEHSEHINHLRKFITNRFVNEQIPYPLTSWISNKWIFGNVENDAILYPSIATKMKCCNYAFHPNTVDSYFQFKRVIRVNVVDIKDGGLLLRYGKCGELSRSKLLWRKMTNEEGNLFLNLNK